MLCDARAPTSGGAGEGPNADPGLSPVVERNVPHGEVFLEEAFANNYGFTAMNAGCGSCILRPASSGLPLRSQYARGIDNDMDILFGGTRQPQRHDATSVRDLTTIARQSAHGNRCAVR